MQTLPQSPSHASPNSQDRSRPPAHVADAGKPRTATGPDLEVEIISFKKFTRGALCGWVDVLLPQLGLKILSVGLFEKDGKRWLKLPQCEFESSSGERKFSSLIEFTDREAHDKFQRPALAALDVFRHGGDL